MSKGIYEGMNVPPHGSEIAVAGRKEVYDMIIKFGAIVDTYFETESIVPHDERFLVVSRAINAFGVDWNRHFWSEFNPDNYNLTKKPVL